MAVAARHFFVVQLFLLGTISAQSCETFCTLCKVISHGEFEGTWNLKDTDDWRCSNSCLYQRNNDSREMCFCDPGIIQYKECQGNSVETSAPATTPITTLPGWKSGRCFSNAWLYAFPKNLDDNSIASCRSHCKSSEDGPYKFFGLYNTKGCLCGNTEVPNDTYKEVDAMRFCDASCPGNTLEMCGGGEEYMNVHAVEP